MSYNPYGQPVATYPEYGHTPPGGYPQYPLSYTPYPSYPPSQPPRPPTGGGYQPPTSGYPYQQPYQPQPPQYQPPPQAQQPAPQAPAPHQYVQASGYDLSKLQDTSYHSPKYDLGRYTQDIGLQRLMTPEGQQALQAQLAQNPYYKNVRVSGDKIFYTGQNGQPVTIDYIQGMNSGHPQLNYLTSDHPGGTALNGAPLIHTALQGGGAGSSGVAGAVASGIGVPGGSIAAANPSATQGSGPNSGIASSETSLLQNYLNNPYSLSPEVIAQMKGVEHDQNAMAQKQLGEQISQAFASRGTYGSGAETAAQRRSASDAYSSLLGAYRQTDIDAAKQRTQDILSALGASNTYMGREEDLMAELKRQAIQRELGLGDLNQRALDRGERGREYNLGLGFDYTQLGMTQDQAILRALGLG